MMAEQEVAGSIPGWLLFHVKDVLIARLETELMSVANLR